MIKGSLLRLEKKGHPNPNRDRHFGT